MASFTIADAAQRLNCSDHTVRRRIKAGEVDLPAVAIW
jgi:excisionase family DNA binding protein